MQIDVSEEISKAVLSAFAKASLDRVLARLANKVEAGNLDPSIVRSRLELHAAKISQVKTLLSTDSHVEIEKFYCPPRIR